jgi:multidrug efflux system outer membrane protein
MDKIYQTIPVILFLMMAGCASWLSPKAKIEVPVANAWHAPLPHQGSTADLLNWWGRFEDPLLVEWIALAQKHSATLAAAKSQVLSARANRIAGTVALFPDVNLVASGTRSVTINQASPHTLFSGGAQASWEPGLWGQSFAAMDGLDARYQAAQAQWHDARTLVAAEMAQSYFAYRLCVRQLDISQTDLTSREQTNTLTAITEKAGFTAPAEAALVRARYAEAKNRVAQQEAGCEKLIKSLVVLTALEETEVRSALEHSREQHPLASSGDGKTLEDLLTVPAVPANLIAQRPDVFAAQREVIATSALVGISRATMLPHLSINGTVSANRLLASGMETDFNAWSMGPVNLSMPLLNLPALTASTDAAKAAYEQAITTYQSSVRKAIRDVEQALIDLDNIAKRVEGALNAAEGYAVAFVSTDMRYREGLASLMELEEARRYQLSADNTLINLRAERISAWIALYRAMGGGWNAAQTFEETKDKT